MKITFFINVFQEKFRMTKHFFIFISDNFKYYESLYGGMYGGDADYDSRKILHTYMNRVTINENDQHEILSYHEFVDAPGWKFKSNEFVKLNKKYTHDKNILNKARSSIYSLET